MEIEFIFDIVKQDEENVMSLLSKSHYFTRLEPTRKSWDNFFTLVTIKDSFYCIQGKQENC